MSAVAERTVAAERQLTLTRIFDAPRERVWCLWTEPEQVARWWGPQNFTNPVCEMDVRVGGQMLIHMRGPDGAVHPMTATYVEVTPPERLVFLAFAEDRDGTIALECPTTVTFAANGGRTLVGVHAHAIGLAATATPMLAGMEAGWSQSLDKLGALAASTPQPC
jgi:uncharacterized protein YndB with AHSA1/START domain